MVMSHEINSIIAIDKKDLEKWLFEKMREAYLRINENNAYIKLEALIEFELLDDLRKSIQSAIMIDGNLYKKIYNMSKVKRHSFDVKLNTDEQERFKLDMPKS